MSRIFVTGDTHNNIDIGKFMPNRFPAQDELTKDDYLIVCGDWGAIWYNDEEKDKFMLDWWTERPWTTIVVLGNHENYNRIESDYLETEWHGAKCYKVNSSIYIMKRGEIFTIDGKKFFCFGGAPSSDKYLREENISWWAREMPADWEYEMGFNSLAAAEHKVDYIISHEICSEMQDNQFTFRHYWHNDITNYLKIVKQDNEFKHHYAGHYHIDYEFENLKSTILYDKIIEIKD